MYPSLVLENQFGEVSNNFIKGGSNQINCNFIVDSTNGNGLGIRSLKSTGPGVKAVYMHTSATPDPSNPNPAAGYILIEFETGYAGYVNGAYGFVSPVSGTPINVTSGVTLGLVYVIVSVGTTSAAQWQLLGLPANITPAVGVAFVAKASTTATGTGVVEVQKASGAGVTQIQVIGDPNLSVNTADGKSGTMVLVCLGNASYTPAGTNDSSTPPLFTGTPATILPGVAAPADGTVIGLAFNMVPLPAPLI